MSAIGGFNRFAQYGLVIQLLTGGYMMTKGEYSVPWMIIVTVLLLAMFAFGGIMTKPLRLAAAGMRENRDVSAETAKIRTMSLLLMVSLVIMIFLHGLQHDYLNNLLPDGQCDNSSGSLGLQGCFACLDAHGWILFPTAMYSDTL
ncbi:hypothetical protein ACFTAO_12425 [Paenibacillus rhizoplanae]